MQDRRLASHVLSVHKEGHAAAPTEGPAPLSPDLLRAYVAAAKSHDPFFPEDLTGDSFSHAYWQLVCCSKHACQADRDAAQVGS